MKKLFLFLMMTLLSLGVVYSANEFQYYRMYFNDTPGANFVQFAKGAWCFDNSGNNAWNIYGISYASNHTGPPDTTGWVWSDYVQTTIYNFTQANKTFTSFRPYVRASVVDNNQPNVYIQVDLSSPQYCRNFSISGIDNTNCGQNCQIGKVTIRGSVDNSSWTTLAGRNCAGIVNPTTCDMNNSFSEGVAVTQDEMRIANNTFGTSSWNLTSDGGQKCGWNTTSNSYNSCSTEDTTPTIRASTVSAVDYLTISNLTDTVTDLFASNGLEYGNCTSGDSTAWTCSYPSALGFDNQTLYLAAQKSGTDRTTFTNGDKGNITILAPDTTPPQVTNFQSNPSSPTVYAKNKEYQFNITATDNTAVTQVLFELNFTNYTASLLTGNIYNVTLRDIAAGNYTYRWFASDAAGNMNDTVNGEYTINLVGSTCSVSTNSAVTYPGFVQVNASCSNPEQAMALYRNDTNITNENGTSVRIAAGLWNYVANVSRSQNYSSASDSSVVTVNQGSLVSSISLSPSSSVTYPTQTTASFTEPNVGDSGVDYVLHRNGTQVSDSDVQTLGVADYLYMINSSGGQNWTSTTSINTSVLSILQNSTYLLNLALSPASSNVYGTETTATGSGCPSGVTCDLYRNGTSVSNPDVQTLGVGDYSYNYTFAGNQNYSFKNITSVLSITQVTSTCSISTNSPQTYPNQIQVNGSCSSPEQAMTIYRNGTNVTSTNGTFVLLGVGDYNYVVNVSSSQNYTSASDSEIVSVNQGTGAVFLYLDNLRQDRSIFSGDSILINATLINGSLTGSSDILNLSVNASVLSSSGTSNLSTLYVFNASGDHLVKADYSGNQNWTSASESWIVSIIEILIDGSSTNKTYEFQTTVNITTTLPRVTIYDATNRVNNRSISGNYSYFINILRLEVANTTLNDTSEYAIKIDNRTSLVHLLLNISGKSNTFAYPSSNLCTSNVGNCSNANDRNLNTSIIAPDDGANGFAYQNFTIADTSKSYSLTMKESRSNSGFPGNLTCNYGFYCYNSSIAGFSFVVYDNLDCSAEAGVIRMFNVSIPSICYESGILQVAHDTHALASTSSTFYENYIYATDNSLLYPGDTIVQTPVENISLPGTLYGTELYQNRFRFLGKDYQKFNLTFLSAEVRTVQIPYSKQGNDSRIGIFNFSLKGFEQDGQNGFNIANNLSSASDITNATTQGSFAPIAGFWGNQSYETFYNNATASRWNIEGDAQFYSPSENICTVGNRIESQACLSDSGAEEGLERSFFTEDINLYDVEQVRASYYLSCHCNCQLSLNFADGENPNVVVGRVKQDNCPYTGASVNMYCNSTITRTSATQWEVQSEEYSAFNACPSGTFDTSSLGDSYYLSLKNDFGTSYTTSYSYTMQFLSYEIAGARLNKTAYAYQGVSQGGSFIGNWTTGIINTTPTNIERAILSYESITPSGTSVKPYLSNDNGTTFEPITNGESHLFLSAGNQLKARFFFNSTSNITTPRITSYRAQVIPSAISSLDIDIGADNSVEMSIDSPLNQSNATIWFSGNDSQVNRYIFNNCSEPCFIPITFSSGSGGIVEISNINLTENINPIRLNKTLYEDENSINLSHTTGILDYFGFMYDYMGSKNITIELHDEAKTSAFNFSITVKYSPFNLTIPSGQEFWQIFPSSRTQQNVIPFGQNATYGFWQPQSLAYDSPIDLYLRYNESINSCVTTIFSSNNFSQGTNFNDQNLNITISNLTQKLTENLTVFNKSNVWTYSNLNCSTSSGVIIPLYCFTSLCTDCVRTIDVEDNCEFLE